MSDTLSAIVSPAKRVRLKPALYIGLAGDSPRAAPARLSLAGLDRVDLGRGERRHVLRSSVAGADVLTVTLPDLRMSGQHARISRVGGTWVLEDLGSKNGTWVATERIQRKTLEDGTAFVVGHTAIVFRDVGGEEGDLDGLPPIAAPGLATLSPVLEHRFADLARGARSNVPIEITGQTGTGKELIARAVHQLSGRSGRFVAVNCGALPATLLEGELFGHKKGAYTGAEGERLGLVRTADRGTLFLDEVAELPAASQAALLRVLQEGEVVPLGADRPVTVDVRIVTATHKSLDTEVDANRFRADLRARLLGVGIALPPLSERREDLGLLVTVLLEKLAPGREVSFAADAVGALYSYDWPLNVRELERVLAAALAVGDERIELDHLPASIRDRNEPTAHRVDASSLSDDDRALRDQLSQTLAKHDGNVAAVARELGKDRTQIRRWMKRLGLSRSDEE